jgi:hypothetical protein
MDTMRALFESLEQRRRPEDVAQMVLEGLGKALSNTERQVLDLAARGSLKRGLITATSMMERFQHPTPPERQVRKALELFQGAAALTAAECADPARVEAFIRQLGPSIHKAFGHSQFKQDRLNGQQREAAGLELSKRRYNKLFRFLGRLEAKLQRYAREQRKYEFTRIGKSSLATRLTWEEFSRDRDAACFIAYYTARSNLRSQFTTSGQERPYDEVAEMLLARCKRARDSANWWAIAHVFPDAWVLAQLSDEHKGVLLGTWLGVLADIADLLRQVWKTSDIRLETMVVRRGNDSTTWNNTASAWNKARASWLALLHALGLEELLDTLCPGKVMRLIAGDVAAWHVQLGGKLDANTHVWAELPRPWDVLSGEATCTRAQVESVCRKHGVDPEKEGWTAPPQRRAVAFRPTPELVHGVTVASPQLASVLRKAGWFSGKSAGQPPEGVEPVRLHRDAHGFVTGVDTKDQGVA